MRKSFGSLSVIHGIDVEIADGEFVVLVRPGHSDRPSPSLRMRKDEGAPLRSPAGFGRQDRRAMQAPPISFDMTVDELMRRWPATVRVLLDRRMLCVGCPVSRFHTLAEACEAHGIAQDGFEARLAAALEADGRAAAPRL